jgi:hypothetical protein
VVNSKSDEALDYRWAEENGETLTALAIGGLSLSRGLTLEGLMVSYMYRNTRMYDTLMQMGRWFGYRGGYEDLCRVWLSQDSQRWYEGVAERMDELRQQIIEMRRLRLTPEQFGLYIRTHPDALTITALNKMRHAKKIKIAQNYSGKLVETHVLPTNQSTNESNSAAVRKLFQKLSAEGICKPIDEPIKAYFWSGVSSSIIENFLNDFKFHKELEYKRDLVLKYLHKISEKYPLSDIAFISLKKLGNTASKFELDSDNYIVCQERSIAMRDEKVKVPSGELGFYTRKERVASRGTEAVGLSTEQIDEVKKSSEKKNISDLYYRNIRKKPLLMIHALRLVVSSDEHTETREDRIPAVGISFPGGDFFSAVEIEIMANSVFIKQLEEESFDDPDEEDDYDN